MPFGNRKKNTSEIFLVQYCQNLKNIISLETRNVIIQTIFLSFKLRTLIGKILRISLKLNFTPNILGCYGFSGSVLIEN